LQNNFLLYEDEKKREYARIASQERQRKMVVYAVCNSIAVVHVNINLQQQKEHRHYYKKNFGVSMYFKNRLSVNLPKNTI